MNDLPDPPELIKKHTELAQRQINTIELPINAKPDKLLRYAAKTGDFRWFDKDQLCNAIILAHRISDYCKNKSVGYIASKFLVNSKNKYKEFSDTRNFLRDAKVIKYDTKSAKPGKQGTRYLVNSKKIKILFEYEEFKNLKEHKNTTRMTKFEQVATDAHRWVVDTINYKVGVGHRFHQMLETLKNEAPERREGVHGYPYWRNLMAWQQIEGVIDWTPSIGSGGNRLYHCITPMRDKLRSWLTIDGENCTEIDLVSCFPTLCLGLYPDNHPEKQDYRKLVLEEGFYEWFLSKKNVYDGIEFNRKTIKPLVFKNILFANNNDYRTGVWYQFKDRFPYLANKFLEITENGDSLSANLQRLEASVMFKNVVPALMKKGIPCVTIHDSIMVPEKYAFEAEKAMYSGYSKKLGDEVKFHVTNRDSHPIEVGFHNSPILYLNYIDLNVPTNSVEILGKTNICFSLPVIKRINEISAEFYDITKGLRFGYNQAMKKWCEIQLMEQNEDSKKSMTLESLKGVVTILSCVKDKRFKFSARRINNTKDQGFKLIKNYS